MSRARRISTCLLITLATLALPACGSGSSANPESFCTAYIDAARTGAELRDPSASSLVDYRRQLDATDRQVSDAAKHAPSDISKEVDELAKPLHDFRAAIDKARTDSEVRAAVKAYGRAQNSLKATRDVVDAWTATHCGVTPITTAPTTSDVPMSEP